MSLNMEKYNNSNEYSKEHFKCMKCKKISDNVDNDFSLCEKCISNITYDLENDESIFYSYNLDNCKKKCDKCNKYFSIVTNHDCLNKQNELKTLKMYKKMLPKSDHFGPNPTCIPPKNIDDINIIDFIEKNREKGLFTCVRCLKNIDIHECYENICATEDTMPSILTWLDKCRKNGTNFCLTCNKMLDTNRPYKHNETFCTKIKIPEEYTNIVREWILEQYNKFGNIMCPICLYPKHYEIDDNHNHDGDNATCKKIDVNDIEKYNNILKDDEKYGIIDAIAVSK